MIEQERVVTTQTTQVSIRLSDETIRQISDLQNSWGENRSQVIIRCIERMWTQNVNLNQDNAVVEMFESDVTERPNEGRS